MHVHLVLRVERDACRAFPRFTEPFKARPCLRLARLGLAFRGFGFFALANAAGGTWLPTPANAALAADASDGAPPAPPRHASPTHGGATAPGAATHGSAEVQIRAL